MNLNDKRLRVRSTADQGVVTGDTVLHLFQSENRVFGRYSGGSIVRGWLVGALRGRELYFRYFQRESSGGIHAGHSVCELDKLADGRLRLVEHFTWETRPGFGTNTFDEIVPTG